MCSAIWSNSSWSAMKLGPFTFQWACLAWVPRSMASASRSFSRFTIGVRTEAGRSFRVSYMRVTPIFLYGVHFPLCFRGGPMSCLDGRDSSGLWRLLQALLEPAIDAMRVPVGREGARQLWALELDFGDHCLRRRLFPCMCR